MPGKKVSSKAHLFVNSIAVCNVNYVAFGLPLLFPERASAEQCRNCLRMENAEVFR
jgi:hypothetical protein